LVEESFEGSINPSRNGKRVGFEDPTMVFRERSAKPEERLLIALLEQASSDARLPGPLGDGAREYVAARETMWPMSFLRICEHFELDPDAVEKAILSGQARSSFGRYAAGSATKVSKLQGAARPSRSRRAVAQRSAKREAPRDVLFEGGLEFPILEFPEAE
jgi:hypothetical protein